MDNFWQFRLKGEEQFNHDFFYFFFPGWFGNDDPGTNSLCCCTDIFGKSLFFYGSLDRNRFTKFAAVRNLLIYIWNKLFPFYGGSQSRNRRAHPGEVQKSGSQWTESSAASNLGERKKDANK
jgi:hypothetical protein